MRLKILTILIASLAWSATVLAEGNVMFEQANSLYHSKNYDSAAKLYTQLVQSGFASDDLFYNMGNAFYKSGKVGWAIWSYRKSMEIRWAIIALLSFIAFLAQLYVRLIRKKRLSPIIGNLLLGIFLLCAFLMFIQYYNGIHHYEAVVVERVFFESEGSSEPEKIPEGTEIKIVDKEPANKKGYVLIQLSDLREGYVSKKGIKRI